MQSRVAAQWLASSATTARLCHRCAPRAQVSAGGSGAAKQYRLQCGGISNNPGGRGCIGMVCIVPPAPPGSPSGTTTAACSPLHGSATCVGTVVIAHCATTVDAATNTTVNPALTSTAAVGASLLLPQPPSVVATAVVRAGCAATAAAIATASITYCRHCCRPVGPCGNHGNHGNQAPHWKRWNGRAIAVV